MAFEGERLSEGPAPAVFALARSDGQKWTWGDMVLVEFSIVPIGKGESVSQYVAECLKIVEASGLPYRINPMGTVVEGEYDAVMSVIRTCHFRVTELCPRVITSIRIDDRKGARGTIDRKVESVEARLGRELRK